MHSFRVPLYPKINFQYHMQKVIIVKAFLLSHVEYEVKSLASHAFM